MGIKGGLKRGAEVVERRMPTISKEGAAHWEKKKNADTLG